MISYPLPSGFLQYIVFPALIYDSLSPMGRFFCARYLDGNSVVTVIGHW